MSALGFAARIDPLACVLTCTDGFLPFISGVTPADLLATSMTPEILFLESSSARQTQNKY